MALGVGSGCVTVVLLLVFRMGFLAGFSAAAGVSLSMSRNLKNHLLLSRCFLQFLGSGLIWFIWVLLQFMLFWFIRFSNGCSVVISGFNFWQFLDSISWFNFKILCLDDFVVVRV